VQAKSHWCEIRKTVFTRTRTRLSLHIRLARKLTLNEAPVVTVIGKAFSDIPHAPKNHSNRRKRLPNYALWEIHNLPINNRVEDTEMRVRFPLPAFYYAFS
jgi:hypothetical protein